MKTADQPAEKNQPIPVKCARARVSDRWRMLSPGQRNRLMGCFVFVGSLTLVFLHPLVSLTVYASGTELHSHIVLIPFISAYLFYLQRRQLSSDYQPSPGWAALPMAASLAALGAAWHFQNATPTIPLNDHLALLAFSYVCLLATGGFLFLGRKWMAAAAFPVAFLIFMVPLPERAVDWLETAAKLASAEAADLFFSMTGTPVLRDSTVFQLPGIVIEVAQECSGIRSSWVLFITSLLASHLFLKSPWRRIILVAFVIPLAIIRNGFRSHSVVCAA